MRWIEAFDVKNEKIESSNHSQSAIISKQLENNQTIVDFK